MRRLAGAFRFAVLAAAALVTFCASPAFAQIGQSGREDARHEGIGVGVKVGPLFSNLDFSEDSEFFERRTGFMGGIFVGGNRPGLVGVMAEVNLMKRKAVDRPVVGLPADYDLTVIDVPVMLRINGGSKTLSGVSGYFVIGPGFDVNLTSEIDDIDVKDDTESFDVNLNIGGGVEITRFIVELRYIKGLRNIAKDLTGTQEIKTKAFALLFGFRFN